MTFTAFSSASLVKTPFTSDLFGLGRADNLRMSPTYFFCIRAVHCGSLLSVPNLGFRVPEVSVLIVQPGSHGNPGLALSCLSFE